MAKLREVQLPSGMQGRVRAIKTRDIEILTDAQALRKGTALDHVLGSCWAETHTPGPYAFSGPPDWSRVLIGDRFAALLAIRMATYGETYAFKVQCINPMCGERFDWEIDLERDLSIKPYKPEALEAFGRDNRFEGTLPDGRKVWFRLLVGKDEQKAMTQKGRSITLALSTRIVEIDGVHPNDKLRTLDDLDMDEARDVLAMLDEMDGGVDTDIEVRCTECGGVQEVALPFVGPNFLLPKKRSKTTRES